MLNSVVTNTFFKYKIVDIFVKRYHKLFNSVLIFLFTMPITLTNINENITLKCYQY